MILDPQLARLAEWFAGLQGRAGELLDQRLRGDCLGSLEQVAATLEQVMREPAEPEDALVHLDADDTRHPLSRTRWRTALEQEIRPAIHGARDTLNATAAAFDGGLAAAMVLTDLARTVAEEPELYFLERAAEDSTTAPKDAPAQVAVPLRRWLDEVFQQPVRQLIDELTTRAAALAREAATELERIETVLDYHLFIVEDSRELDARDESARTGLGHGIRLVRQLSERTDHGSRRLFTWFVGESSERMDDALAPLRAHRPDEILQELELRAERRRPSWLRQQRERARDSAADLYGRAAPFVRELARDLRSAFAGDAPRVGYWDLLIAGDHDGRLPPIYRRLFGEVPLGLSDLYQSRPRLEAPCRQVFETWLGKQRTALLVVGDRGSGKRTLVNRVRAELHGELPVHWLSLGPHLASESRLCAAMCEATGVPYATSFAEFGRHVPLLGARRVLILENAEQLFVRTPEGLRRMQDFLDLVRATDEALLWVVLIAAPAATLLQTCLKLPLYFGQVVTIPHETGGFIETMIRSRHRVSGFGLRFRARRPPALQRLRRPFTSTDMLPDPGEEWFIELERMCDGNLRQALDYWLLSARLDMKTEHDVVVRPLPRRRGRALAGLSLSQRLVLVSLVQHGALSEAQLGDLLRLANHGLAPEIDDLRRRKLIDQAGPGGYLHLRPTAIGPVTHDLRWRNMI